MIDSMRRFPTVFIFAALLTCGTQMASAAQPSPAVVTRIFTGSDGQTHAENVDLTFSPVGGNLAQFAQWWTQSATQGANNVQFVRLAPGFVQDWHPAGARRYLISLSGQGEIELANGQKITLQPGRVLLAEDVTGKGHRTRTLGNEDWIALFVQLQE